MRPPVRRRVGDRPLHLTLMASHSARLMSRAYALPYDATIGLRYTDALTDAELKQQLKRAHEAATVARRREWDWYCLMQGGPPKLRSHVPDLQLDVARGGTHSPELARYLEQLLDILVRYSGDPDAGAFHRVLDTLRRSWKALPLATREFVRDRSNRLDHLRFNHRHLVRLYKDMSTGGNLVYDPRLFRPRYDMMRAKQLDEIELRFHKMQRAVQGAFDNAARVFHDHVMRTELPRL